MDQATSIDFVGQLVELADQVGATVVLIIVIWLFIKGKIVSQAGIEFTIRRMVKRMNGNEPGKPSIVEIRPYCPDDIEDEDF